MKGILFTLSIIATLSQVSAKELPWYFNSDETFGINPTEAIILTKGGSPKLTVAVVDTGVDTNHKDIKHSLLEKDGSNFARYTTLTGVKKRVISSYMGDDHGHGTHVTGIIAGTYNKQVGFTGIAPKVQILPVKYYNKEANNKENQEATIKGLAYAVKNNVDIINYSSGGPAPDLEERAVLEEARKKGIIIVVAAGNEEENIDNGMDTYFPCNYDLSNIICVGSVNRDGKVSQFSNYGKNSVDLFAPGNRIKSTIPHGKYGYLSGSSQAAAFVTGAVSLMKTVNPNLTPAQVKKILMDTATTSPYLYGKSKSKGVLNISKAVKMARIFKK